MSKFLLEQLDKRFEELEEKKDVLEILSEDKLEASDKEIDKAKLKVQKYERFFYQESLRNLFTSIKFLDSDNPIKTIALTSSTITGNLAFIRFNLKFP